MTVLNSCCCWKNLQLACLASCLFTLLTSFFQIFLQIAVYVGEYEKTGNAFGETKEQLQISLMYVVLAAMDGVVILLSAIALSAVELGFRGVNLFLPWLVFLPIYMIYEAAINIYYFYMQFTAIDETSLFTVEVTTYAVVPLIYWCLKITVNVFGYLAVFSRIQELREAKRQLSNNAPTSGYHETAINSVDSQVNQMPCTTCQHRSCSCTPQRCASRLPRTEIVDWASYVDGHRVYRGSYYDTTLAPRYEDTRKLPRYSLCSEEKSENGPASQQHYIGRY